MSACRKQRPHAHRQNNTCTDFHDRPLLGRNVAADLLGAPNMADRLATINGDGEALAGLQRGWTTRTLGPLES